MAIREDAAYNAGLFEGEGTVGCYTYKTGKKQRQLKLIIAMTDLFPLQIFQENAEMVGRISGPYTFDRKDTFSNKPVYRYQATKFEEVQYLVAMMWEFLSPRRKEQCRKALLTFRGAEVG